MHENSRNTEENKAVAFSGMNFLHSKQVASNIPYLKEGWLDPSLKKCEDAEKNFESIVFCVMEYPKK